MIFYTCLATHIYYQNVILISVFIFSKPPIDIHSLFCSDDIYSFEKVSPLKTPSFLSEIIIFCLDPEGPVLLRM